MINMHRIWTIKDFSHLSVLATLERLSIALVVIFLFFVLITLLAKRITYCVKTEDPSAVGDEELRRAAAVAAARHLHETSS